MTHRSASRLLDHLPAIYREGGEQADLARLLRAFEELLFTGWQAPGDGFGGIERELQDLPALFAPLGLGDLPDDEARSARTPDRFLPWLATWLAFAPHALVSRERLRHVVAGIVPLYGRRGTRAYLETLLPLCFDEIASVRIDEGEMTGLRLGASTLGVDSVLAEERPFWFSVDIIPAAPLRRGPAASARFEQRLRAIIDFAKPAHTAYELKLRLDHAEAAGGPGE